MQDSPFVRLKVLVVDDEEEICRMIERSLAFSDGFQDTEFFMANTFARAMEIIESDRPHVVLQDINLPDGNGLQLIRQMKAVHPLVQFIVITGASDLERVMDAAFFGAVDYVKKPLDLEMLLEVMEDAKKRCQRWGQLFKQEYEQDDGGFGPNDDLNEMFPYDRAI